MKRTRGTQYQPMTFNLEAEQARQLRALYALAGGACGYSDMAREAFREYLAKRVAPLSVPANTSTASMHDSEVA